MVTFTKIDPTTRKRKTKDQATRGLSEGKPIEQYTHKGKDRINNPPVGLVTPETDKDVGKKTYSYDYHLDPTLVWAGKAEHTSFEIPTVSLHVHERIDPRRIIGAVQKVNAPPQPSQGSLFESREENLPLRQAIEFYKHRHNWSNRLIAGDSLLVMNSLLEKEGMAGHVQMVYIDPPYGIKYGSNFQPFVNKRDVKDRKDDDLTQEPETLKAFRDTWELHLHSYLAYLRDRIKLAHELLSDTGSAFIQISDENLHHVREIMDEVFGAKNFCVLICYRRLGTMIGAELKSSAHYLIWYAKDRTQYQFHKIFEEQVAGLGTGDHFTQLEDPGTLEGRAMTREERANPNLIPASLRPYQLVSLQTHGVGSTNKFAIEFKGKKYLPGPNKAWRTTEAGIKELIAKNRIQQAGKTIRFKQFLADFPFTEVGSIWSNAGRDPDNLYAVQTPTNIIARCLLMTTSPGELVLDITCGSGTTAYVAERWGRRWITCDTSRIAITLARQRLMTALFDYYRLSHPDEGVASGFEYKKVPHITLQSLANSEPSKSETMYDQPIIDGSRLRVTGPFTVEAVPAPTVTALNDIDLELSDSQQPADTSIVRSGETLRQSEWRDELLKTAIRGKGGQKISFSRVEALPGTRWLHADAETIASDQHSAQRVAVSFGPQHQSLEQRQVALALEEAQQLIPKPKIVVFAAFEFDPEAAKDIDETDWPGVTLLKAKMNGDLFTEDLRKKRSSNESFWLVGQPDVRLTKQDNRYIVEVFGFDYYNAKTGTIESGGAHNIAMWMLDPDYDGRSIFPRQVFFPMSGDKDGWSRLAKDLRAEIDDTTGQRHTSTREEVASGRLSRRDGNYQKITGTLVQPGRTRKQSFFLLPTRSNRNAHLVS